jgi:hypothetical protein
MPLTQKKKEPTIDSLEKYFRTNKGFFKKIAQSKWS